MPAEGFTASLLSAVTRGLQSLAQSVTGTSTARLESLGLGVSDCGPVQKAGHVPDIDDTSHSFQLVTCGLVEVSKTSFDRH